MWSTLSVFVLSVTLVLAQPEEENPFKSALKWVDLINNDPNSTWEAGINFSPETPASYIKKLAGLIKFDPPVDLPILKPFTGDPNKDIPKQFDSRKVWPFCKALRTSRDQGNCGSCWAVATTSAFTDRLCIKTKGKFNSQLSAIQVTSCCTDCGHGCKGGNDGAAWKYFQTHGLVTGGDYGSHKGCQPYPIIPCEHHVKGRRPKCSSLELSNTPACESHCTNKKYKKSIEKDIHKASMVYRVVPGVTDIQYEIMAGGPVSAGISVYDDFLTYKKGVYKNGPKSKWLGLHAVKIIGWGEENSHPYWLVQNSWNSDWGDKGVIKVFRGENTIGIEAEVISGRA